MIKKISRWDVISRLLYDEIGEKFNNPAVLSDDLSFSDNFAEILEKLFILSIRVWRLEDLAGQAKSDEELAELKRKIDFCFKKKRPELIRAINLLLDDHIQLNKKFAEENVKNYSGFSS